MHRPKHRDPASPAAPARARTLACGEDRPTQPRPLRSEGALAGSVKTARCLLTKSQDFKRHVGRQKEASAHSTTAHDRPPCQRHPRPSRRAALSPPILIRPAQSSPRYDWRPVAAFLELESVPYDRPRAFGFRLVLRPSRTPSLGKRLSCKVEAALRRLRRSAHAPA